MSYVLSPGMPLGESVVGVATGEVDAALTALARVHATGDPDAVHDVRKRTKKLRALAVALSGSVPRRQWRAASRAAADAGRTLADSRDAQVRLATLSSLVADRQAEFAVALAHAAQAARPSTSGNGKAGEGKGDEERVQHASWLLTGVAAEIGTWDIPDGFEALAGGLGSTYRDGRQRWRALASVADAGGVLDVEELHRWRRAVKYRWYHTRLLLPVAPDLLGAEVALLDEAGEALGVDHDLAVLTAAIAADPVVWGGPEAVAELVRLAADRQLVLRSRALNLGGQLYVQPTAAHLDRLGRWFRRARTPAAGPGFP